ncbi:hypothetical protein IPG41_05880 [Candidatus Peregrinibacteria bacterium]|nr:MAG: hypothetical protein IPG41_05880 [Candidatus Peregrinibacteria bacterium]
MTPITKICRVSGKEFLIDDYDQAFYAKMQVPLPTLCPEERMRRRLMWRNERKLYHRKCDLCQKEILSIYEDESIQVYCPPCFYSDKWNALNYGRDFNFSRPFFEQFGELKKQVPVLALNLQKDNENCDFTNLTSRNKSCYLVFAGNDNEDCYYCTYLHRSRNLLDCFFIFDSELCYECIDCYSCYRLTYSQNCQSCSDSTLMYNCRSCKNCFGCVSLVNKEYCLFNEQLSKEDYEQRVQEIRENPERFLEAKNSFEALKMECPQKYYAGVQNESFTGDHIAFSKNVYDSYDCTHLEDCRYCTWLHNSRDCQDCYAWGITGELGYENHLCGNNFYNVAFSDSCWNDVSNLRYCHYCVNNSQDLFGCIGLNKQRYCILNKQYTKEEYEALVPRIIEHMQKTGEWGEFFPPSLAYFAYNETVAQEYFPLVREQVLALGLKWKDEEKNYSYSGPKLSPPARIEDTDETLLSQILCCYTCEKSYKVIKQELALYKNLGVAAPVNCFDCRYKARLAKRNPRHLWLRSCGACGVQLQSSFVPDQPEKIFCEACYLKTIY